jgi:hypothetical protein
MEDVGLEEGSEDVMMGMGMADYLFLFKDQNSMGDIPRWLRAI